MGFIRITLRCHFLMRVLCIEHHKLKPDFHMVVTVVKIELRSFSSAEIQHFGYENTRSDYN